MSRRSLRMRWPAEAGFTLIEVMTVVLVIGILIGIGLPAFLGARSRSQDRAVQAELRTGLAAGLSYFAEAQTWDGFDAATATTTETSLAWVDAVDPAVGEISIVVHAGWDFLLVGESGSGRFFCVAQVQTNPATLRGDGATFAAVDTVAECIGGW